MATVSTNAKTHRKRLIFKMPHGGRQAIHLGNIRKQIAREIGEHVDHLVRCIQTGEEPKRRTVEWVVGIQADWPELAARLTTLGLLNNGARADEVFADFVDEYILSRKDVKPGTTKVWKQTATKIRAFFERRTLKNLTKKDGKDFDRWLKTPKALGGAGHKASAAGKHLSFARGFLNEAVDAEIIAANPFRKVKADRTIDKSRQRFVAAETIEKVISLAPDAEMRAIIALSRWGGLRTPSEPFALQWRHIDWERRRINVQAPKTEKVGKPTREIPLFPELVPYLLDLQETADDVSPDAFIIARRRLTTDANIRRRMMHLVAKAGFETWPKIFHNLRASRQTELEERFPRKTVCEWMGNSEDIADRHYLQVMDSHFDDASSGATRNPTRNGEESRRTAAKTAKRLIEGTIGNRPSFPVDSQSFATVTKGAYSTTTEADGNRTHQTPLLTSQRF